MGKQGLVLKKYALLSRRGGFILFFSCLFLSSCLSGLWTGASLAYDRHNVYKKLNDYQLLAKIHHVLYKDKLFKQPGCVLDLAVFNGDILLAGHVLTNDLRETAIKRVAPLSGYRRLFNQLAVGHRSDRQMEDSWLTTKICSQIIADADIDPSVFKVTTSDGIVYLMGDVRPNQAERVVTIARSTVGVLRVVRLFKYYNLSLHPSKDD